MTVPKRPLSLYTLIAANLIPVVGVLLLGWDMRDALFLYWMENLIVGFFAVLRIAFAPGNPFGKIFAVPFFCFHFGMFTLVHGVFVIGLTAGFGSMSAGLPVLDFVIELVSRSAPYAAVILFLSHGYSFVFNYLGRGEREKTDVGQEMGRPYSRVMVMHFTILAAFFLMLPLGMMSDDPAAAVRIVPALILIIIKTLVDATTHRRAHARRDIGQEGPEPQAAT
ncbi:hypothetical protein AMJ57_03335 [Parcubacteria bacterium SG8_24]|nr:MAG: hypothetical protein AMJ57_03335 [Parcubacteria bacterium SG8_24]